MGEMRKDRRRYLTGEELRRLIVAAKEGRNGQRDATLILVVARHGLRVSEACELKWDQIDWAQAHLRRKKGGTASVHPIQGDELRSLRELRRKTEGAFVFASERKGPLTRSAVAKMIYAAGERAAIRAHPHMLRHTCGHLLADAGHDTRRLRYGLGTRISNTQRTIASLARNHSRSFGDNPSYDRSSVASENARTPASEKGTKAQG
jgi:integrase